MKFIQLLAVAIATVTTSQAVNLEAHNTGADDKYLTKVFHKWDQLGLDAQGEPNGKRVLTKDNAERAAREVAAKWKGLSGKELEDFVESRMGSTWANFGVGDHIDVRDAYYWVRQLVDTDGTHGP